jgi:hypothetical protein
LQSAKHRPFQLQREFARQLEVCPRSCGLPANGAVWPEPLRIENNFSARQFFQPENFSAQQLFNSLGVHPKVEIQFEVQLEVQLEV